MPTLTVPVESRPAPATTAPEIIDVAIIGGENDEAKTAFQAMIVQDRNFRHILVPTTPHELFDQLRTLTAGGKRKIGRLVLCGHGDAPDHYLSLSGEALLPTDVDLRAIRSEKRQALASAEACRRQVEENRRLLSGMKTDKERDTLREWIARDEGVEALHLATFRRCEQRETDLLGVADVMAEGGVVGMINCSPASDAAGRTFVANLGRIFLGKRGGRIVAARGDVHFLQIAWLVQALKHGAEIGDFVMWADGGWLTLPFAKPPDSGLDLGRIFVTGEVFDLAAPVSEPVVAQTTLFLGSGAGRFHEQHWGPEGSSGPPPEPLRFGPLTVPGPGTIRGTIRVDPPNPGGWTVRNSEASLSLELSLAPGSAAHTESLGAWSGGRTALEKPVRLPCSLMVEVAPPVSYGVYGGSHPAQSFAFEVELVPPSPDLEPPRAYAGAVVREGNRYRTGYGRAVLYLSNGVRVLLREHSDLSFSRTATGALRGELHEGSAHVIERRGAPSAVEYGLRGRTVRPGGTALDFDAGWEGREAATLRVYEGSAVIEGIEGSAGSAAGAVLVREGQEIDLARGTVTAIAQGAADVAFDGVALGDLLLDDSPEPAGETEFPILSGELPAGWVWQDPHKIAAWEAAPGVLSISIGRGSVPRLLHKITGDFDLTVRAAIAAATAPGESTMRCFLFAPGSCLGSSLYPGVFVAAKPQEGLDADALTLAGLCDRDGYRTVAAEPSRPRQDGAPPSLGNPVWLRLSRRGERFRTVFSPDGQAWQTAEEQVLPVAPETLWAGWVFESSPDDYFTTETWSLRVELGELRLVCGEPGTLQESGT